jgi:ribonuclease III
LGTKWQGILNATAAWLTSTFGESIQDISLFQRALTHGSHSDDTYERLEFLGDRVLGLTIANWLFERHASEQEGNLSKRLNMLVAGETCADVGRRIGLGQHIRLGKQARDDGAFDSDNVLGDVVEALIGALYIDQGIAAGDRFIRLHWADMMDGLRAAPRHPKSALQEWAAGHNRKAPLYTVLERSGPHHAPRFIVSVSLGSAGDAQGEGKSKQEAETTAAAALLGKLES